MSFTMNLLYRGEGENARSFAHEALSSGLVAKIREFPGNLGYAYYEPLEDRGAVLLIDSWESQEALDAYHASPLMGEIAALRAKYGLAVTARRYLEAAGEKKDERFLSTR